MEQGNNKLSSIPMLSEILDKTNEEICNLPQFEYINEIVNSFGIGQKSPIHPTIIFALRYNYAITIKEEVLRLSEPSYYSTHKESIDKAKSYIDCHMNGLGDSSIIRDIWKRYVDNQHLMLTLETYSFDIIKFWFLLIFIYDYIENTKIDMGHSILNSIANSKKITIEMESDEKKTIDDTSTLSHLKYLFNSLGKLSTLAIGNNLISQEDAIRLEVALTEIGLYNEKLRIGTKILLFDDILYKRFLSRKKYKITGTYKIATGKEILASRVWYTLGYGKKEYNDEDHFIEDQPKRLYDSLLRKHHKTRKAINLWKFRNLLYN